MGSRAAIALLLLSWTGLATAAPREESWEVMWTLRRAVTPEEARLAVADMERLARSAGDALSVWIAEDGTAIRLTAPHAGAAFEFPGPNTGVVVTSSATFVEVVMACVMVARERLGMDVLLWSGDPAIARARFQRVLGRARPPLAAEGFDEPADVRPGVGLGFGTHWVYPMLVLTFLWLRWRGGGGWTSWYLFWLLGPTLVAAFAAQPLALLVIPAALVLRRVLPDPIRWLRHARRVRALSVDIASNASNAAARRALAMIWIDLGRPARALPLLDEALALHPDDIELAFLRGQALLGARRHEQALAAFLVVLEREPRLRYGEAYLRGADALAALERWEEAEEGLAHFVVVNRSSVEGRVKLARVRRARGDRAGAAAAVADAKAAYRDSPAFHRRKQLWWYLRAVLLGWRV